MIIEKTGIAPITGYGASDYTEIIDPNLDADYVYFDSVNGAAGTDWMRGRRGYPVNNWADLVTISTARHTKNVMILNGVLTITADADQYYFTGNGFLDPTALFTDNVIELGGFTLSRCTFDSVNIHNAAGGVLDMCGPFDDCPYVFATTIQNCGLFRECGTINATTMTDSDGFFDCLLITATTMTDCAMLHNIGTINVVTMTTCSDFKDVNLVSVTTMTGCQVFKDVSTLLAAAMSTCLYFSSIDGMSIGSMVACSSFKDVIFASISILSTSHTFVNFGELDITISMTGCYNFINCGLTRALTTMNCTGIGDSGIVNLYGKPLTISNLAGAGIVLDVSGDFTLTIAASCTAGTINVYGNVRVVNNSGGTTVNDYTDKPKAEVAVNTTATNGAETNIFNLATAGFHYTVEKLRLKCADPGANTVTVRLYELINGASVEVDSFAITTVNFGTYFSLMDMFGVDHLVGDNLKVTVRASAGGPYAVTGSYVYRSA
jgi:hypothetical protein